MMAYHWLLNEPHIDLRFNGNPRKVFQATQFGWHPNEHPQLLGHPDPRQTRASKLLVHGKYMIDKGIS